MDKSADIHELEEKISVLETRIKHLTNELKIANQETELSTKNYLDIYTKIEKIISEKFLNKEDIDEIINHAVNDGKFKIYRTIHNKFENVNFEIKKK